MVFEQPNREIKRKHKEQNLNQMKVVMFIELNQMTPLWD